MKLRNSGKEFVGLPLPVTFATGVLIGVLENSAAEKIKNIIK